MPAIPDDFSYSLGVDIGTSFCRASYFDENTNKSIPIRFGKKFDQLQFPTAVVFSKNDPLVNCLVGQDALDAVLVDKNPDYPPCNLVLQLPRLLGKKHSSISRRNLRKSSSTSTSSFDPRFICQTTSSSSSSHENDMACIKIQTVSSSSEQLLLLRPEEVLARIFIAIKSIAEMQMPPEISSITPSKRAKFVVTCPSCFSSTERQAILDAGHIAGVTILRLLSSAMAHAVSAFIHHRSAFSRERESIILEFGGGYTSLTYVLMEDGIADSHSTLGDPTLGGSDVDLRLVSYFIREYALWRNNKNKKEKGRKNGQEEKETNFVDFENDPVSFLKLKFACEEAKILLCQQQQEEGDTTCETRIHLPIDENDNDNEEKFSLVLTRKRFEEVCEDLFRPVYDLLHAVIEESKYNKSFDVLLVAGGASQAPFTQKMLEKFIESKLPAAETKNRENFNKKILPGKMKRGGECLNTFFGTVEGASVYASLLAGFLTTSDILIIDCLSTSVGIETAGGIMTKILSKNSTIPSKQNQVFSTYADNQPAVSIQIFEGEADQTSSCGMMAKFVLDGIPPAPKGVPQIDVSFDIDANGILSVSAYEKSTGRSSMITVSNQLPTSISKSKLEVAIVNAKRFGDEFFTKQEWFVAAAAIEEEAFWSNYCIHHIDSSKPKFEYWKEVAGRAFAKDRFKEAIRLWSLASSEDPSNAIVHSNMSFAFVKLKNRDRALEEALTCVEKDRTWFKGYFRLARVYEIFDRDYEKAKENYEISKSLASEFPKELESLSKSIEEMAAKIA